MRLRGRHGGFCLIPGGALHAICVYRRDHIIARHPRRHLRIHVAGAVNRRRIQRRQTLPYRSDARRDGVVKAP